jgi:branched-chain amino acid transport system permease protein
MPLRSGWRLLKWAGLAGVLLVVGLVPALFSPFVASSIGVQTLALGIAAASIIFLNSVVGMVSLAQTALYGVAGYTTAKLAVEQGVDPWMAALIAVGVTVAVAVGFGAIASRSQGIYFLMITLASAVITYYFFSQVTTFGSHGGINGVTPPPLLGKPFVDPTGMYYAALIGSVLTYGLVRYVRRTPFGYALQGVRDEPVRMRALGFNVPLLRTSAFALGAFIASIAGVLLVWYNSNISPGAIDVTRTIDLLTIAVIGGLGRLEGAWVGALLFTVVQTYSPRYTDRFETLIGLVFLAVVLASPGGLSGLARSLDRFVRVRLGEGVDAVASAGGRQA